MIILVGDAKEFLKGELYNMTKLQTPSTFSL